MAKDSHIAHLTGVPLFRSCSKKELTRLARQIEQLDVDTGEAIVTEGDTGREFFIIVSGAATVSQQGQERRALSAGDSFGELAILLDHPRTATVTASAPTSLLVLDRPAFKAALLDVPEIAVKVLAVVAQRLVDSESA